MSTGLAYRTPEEFAQAWSPSPSSMVIEQTGTSAKDSLTARKNGASLIDAPVLNATGVRAKGTGEGEYDLR
jgi:hypothetical protein